MITMKIVSTMIMINDEKDGTLTINKIVPIMF